MFSIKNSIQIKNIKIASKTVGKILRFLKETTKIGDNGLDLNRRANKIIQENNCETNFLNYNNFPFSICVSVNEVLIHGVPNKKSFIDGDLISVDVGCKYNGMNADAAITFILGKKTKEKEEILLTSKKCLDEVIKIIKPGVSLKKIGYIIERTAIKKNYKLTVDYTGHGIGEKLHEFPNIFNCEELNRDIILPVNSVICIEPMLLIGSEETEILSDGFSVISKNRKLTSHFEHTLLITKDGVEVLTEYER